MKGVLCCDFHNVLITVSLKVRLYLSSVSEMKYMSRDFVRMSLESTKKEKLKS